MITSANMRAHAERLLAYGAIGISGAVAELLQAADYVDELETKLAESLSDSPATPVAAQEFLVDTGLMTQGTGK